MVLSNIWRSQKRWDWGFLCLSMGGATNGPFLGALWKAEEINIATRGTMWGVCGAGWRSKKLRNYGGKLQRTFRPRGQQSWKIYLRSQKPFSVFWDKRCKGCQQKRNKKCTHVHKCQFCQLWFGWCVRRPSRSRLMPPSSGSRLPPVTSPRELARTKLEVSKHCPSTPHIGQGSLKAY